ncbi:hypothetical protein MRX96_056449 [Rhipicephalus microplus]
MPQFRAAVKRSGNDAVNSVLQSYAVNQAKIVHFAEEFLRVLHILEARKPRQHGRNGRVTVADICVASGPTNASRRSLPTGTTGAGPLTPAAAQMLCARIR